MHLHCGRSYESPIHCAHNRIWNFHFPNMQHHPAKFDHFRCRTRQTLEHLSLQETQADDKQLVRHIYPRSHHKQFPRCYYNKLQLFLPSFQILQPVVNLTMVKGKTESTHKKSLDPMTLLKSWCIFQGEQRRAVLIVIRRVRLIKAL